MGHRDSSEEFGGNGKVCAADGRAAPTTEDRVKSSMCEVDEPRMTEEAARDQKSDSQSAAVRVALLALRFYKSYLSILFAGSCRFEPTCSRYAYEAIERFGVLRGTWLGMQRLMRCQPLSRKFGYDPVPEKWENMPSKSVASHERLEATNTAGQTAAVSTEVRP